MFTSFMDAILCCLTGKSANAVGPLETSEPVGGFEFVEVKPGRVLRVLHIVPDRPMVEEMTAGDGASVSCKRRITVFRNGQLLIENVAEAEPPDGCEPPAVPAMSERQQRTWGKAKHTVLIDHERTVTCCKETHPDVALYFIHGVGGSLDMWSRQLDYFSQLGYEVIALDLAGHGARLIFASFCTFLAHEYPEQVHKVVMINGGGPTALEPSLCSVFNLPTCVLHCMSPCLSWSFLMAGFANQGKEEKKLLKEKNVFSVSSFVLRSMMSGQYWPEGDEVYHAELTVPTLLVHGMHDKFVPVQEDQHMAEILLLGFLKVIDEGSHMVMMECPDRVNTLLHEFFLWQPSPQILNKK
uniref:AB hydrolase-1 domain-containing protein n=1 Tax=Electrophorus electricus TaxID=8005 RepID=A0A4W4G201_ELEEL